MEIEAYLHEHIPISAEMGIALVRVDSGGRTMATYAGVYAAIRLPDEPAS